MPRSRPVDVLVDSLEMCHRFEFADRLVEVDARRCPLAELLLSKLQVVKINRKDVLDALVLLAEHPLAQDDGAPDARHGQGAISVPRILSFTSNDWGWWRTVTGNLDTLDQYLATDLTPEDLDLNNGRPVLFEPGGQIAALRTAIDDAPKSTRWKLRARVGERQTVVPGSRGDGAQLMRIFFATDIHGSEVCWRKFLNAGDVPQGGRPGHGRRHDRQGDGPDRQPERRLDASGSRTRTTSSRPRTRSRRWRSGSPIAATTRSG